MSQADVQQVARAIAGTSGQFNEDLHAALSVLGVSGGQLNERLIAYTGAPTASAAFNQLLAAWSPSINLSFINGLDPSMTYTRATTGTQLAVTGLPEVAAPGTPRFDSIGGTRKYLHEGSRQNLLLNADTLSTQSPTVTAVVHTLSFYGTGTITLSGASVAGPLVGTGAAQRVSLTFTPSAGVLTCTVTGSVTFAQLEIGAFASSYIPTAGAPVTRNADNVFIPVNTWLNPVEGTFIIRSDRHVGDGQVSFGFNIDDGSTLNRIYSSYTAAPAADFQVQVTGAAQATSTVGTPANNVMATHAMAYKAGRFSSAFAGVAAADDTVGSVPSGLNVIRLGNSISGGATTYIYGHLEYFRYYPSALPAQALAGLSA
jgi:hypothetical protein